MNVRFKRARNSGRTIGPFIAAMGDVGTRAKNRLYTLDCAIHLFTQRIRNRPARRYPVGWRSAPRTVGAHSRRTWRPRRPALPVEPVPGFKSCTIHEIDHWSGRKLVNRLNSFRTHLALVSELRTTVISVIQLSRTCSSLVVLLSDVQALPSPCSRPFGDFSRPLPTPSRSDRAPALPPA